jgi:hypothetical protein
MSAIELLESRLAEKRTYYGHAGISGQLTRAAKEMKGTVEVLSVSDPFERYRVTHLVEPQTNPEEVYAVSQRLQCPVKLPADFTEFWQKWRRVVLILRQDYWLIPPLEMIDVARQRASYSPESSGYAGVHRLVPFAEVGLETGDYIALRLRKDAMTWETCFYGHEYGTAWVETGGDEWFALDESLTAWFERIIETDGWPPGKYPRDSQVDRVD